MAVLIPSYSTCVGRMTPGERRFAQRLEAKLEHDYLCWYDVAIGPSNVHPDFVVLHPRRGLLVLEVKDWKLETIQSITKQDAAIQTERGIKHVINPLEQARQYVHAISNVLQQDPQLVFSSGSHKGNLVFPWAYGVVLANISRKVFDESGLGDVLPAGRVICQDEMTESVEAEAFQERLWQMFQLQFRGQLSLPQLDRIRWHMFPEIRLPVPQEELFGGRDESIELPDLMRVMDLQQEQLARSLGEGHRVIHGVAGSGKTLILGYRAEQLAKTCEKPILVLCYNRTLAEKLRAWMEDKSIADKVNVRTFHSWCLSQLRAYNVDFLGAEDDYDAMVNTVIRAVEHGSIPAAQYDAVMIDEGHDFRPEWLKLVVQMVDPRTNSLLVLYDDAQSIYDTGGKKSFSFKSVGIQAQGRTTILKINYRNTKEILDFATRFAGDLLLGNEAEEDGVPRLSPVSAGRSGKEPLVIDLPNINEAKGWIASKLKEEHASGRPWRDMAVLCRYTGIIDTLVPYLQKSGIPCSAQKNVRFDKKQDTVKLITYHSSKGLEFPFVLIHHFQSAKETLEEEVRLLYVAMTRSTEQLCLTRVPDSVKKTASPTSTPSAVSKN